MTAKANPGRILTTHIGSLPRPPEVLEALQGGGAKEDLLSRAVSDVVRRQADVGLDIVDDGEFSKPGFIHYINERLDGFTPGQIGGDPFAGSREHVAFPEFYASFSRAMPPNPAGRAVHMECTGPVSYKGQQLLQRDMENLKAAVAGLDIEDVFVPAVSPTSVEMWQSNKFHETQEDYLFGIADALHEEYKGIVDAGFVVQIDDPHMLMYYILKPDASINEVREWAEIRVEAVNRALKGVARDRVRWHTCYGINMGPRVHDLELKHILDLILRIDAGGYSFEGANPRHEHEWRLWEETKLPEGTALIPGVITQSSVLVEHPELVAQRLVKYANLVGRENVIAGADCGFGTFAGTEEIHSSVAWAKLESLVQGARLASEELWR